MAFQATMGNRRDLLRIGSLGLAASVLPRLGPFATAAAMATESGTAQPTADSVILLWMMGGVTHHESFDPKPKAPEEIRGTLKPIATTLPGVQFCETMPELAQLAHHLAVVRSFASGNNDHFMSQAAALSGRSVTREQITTEPNMGSIVSFLHGPRAQLPGYIAVPGITRPGPPPKNLFVGGWLGGGYGPFATGGEPEQPDFTATKQSGDPDPFISENLLPQALRMPAGMDLDRLAERGELRKLLDGRLKAAERGEAVRGMDQHYHNALELLANPQVRAAFDLSAETDVTRERYGRTKLGGRCLLARRLVEAGARFVMVDYGYDPHYGNLWDNHNAAGQNFPHICEMAQRPYHVAGMDRAFAGLLRDLHERGRLERTLVVFLTEFGRTPKINKNGGRDHWGDAGSIFFAGGGVRGGQVVSGTDDQGAYPTGPSYSPGDVAATLYQALGINPQTTLYDRQNRPHFVLPEGHVIPGVLS